MMVRIPSRERGREDGNAALELVVLAPVILFLLGFVLMFVRSVQVAIEHLRQGYSILERPGAYDGSEG